MNKKTTAGYPGKWSALTGHAVVQACAAGIHDLPNPFPSDISSAVGLALTGRRTGCFVSAKNGIRAYDSLCAAAGKHLPLVVNLGCSALSRSSVGFYAEHGAYHAVGDTGCFLFFAKNAQEVADLNLIAHKIAEPALVPGLVAQDQVLTTETIRSLYLPEAGLIAEYLGRSDDEIDSPTPAQKLLFGQKRRRIPELFNMDLPLMSGVIQGPEDHAAGVAAQRPFFTDHLVKLTDEAMAAYARLTGRTYDRAGAYRVEDADYLVIGQGSAMETAEAVADYFRSERRTKVGVVNMTMFRPFPGDLLGRLLKGKKGAVVLERIDQPLSEDLPLMREIRSVVSKCRENGNVGREALPYPEHAVYEPSRQIPSLYSASFGMGGASIQPADVVGAVENMLQGGARKRRGYLSIDFVSGRSLSPRQDIQRQAILDAYPRVADLTIHGSENPDLAPQKGVTIQLRGAGKRDFFRTGRRVAGLFFDLLETHLRARSHKKPEPVGQPAVYSFTVAPGPIKIDSPSIPADVMVSLDSNLFRRPESLASLKENGALVLQSSQESPSGVWQAVPSECRRLVSDKKIRLFAVDFSKIVREESAKKDSEGEFEARVKVLFGVLLAVSEISGLSKRDEEKWAGMAREAPVKRGVTELFEVKDQPQGPSVPTAVALRRPVLPPGLKELPEEKTPIADIHRFRVQTGYPSSIDGDASHLADPFMATGTMPAATGLFRDFSSIRTRHPEWVPSKCTGCGDCWVVCPDSALPPLVCEAGPIFETAIGRLEKAGHPVKHLPRAVRSLEGTLHQLIGTVQKPGMFQTCLEQAIEKTAESSRLSPPEKEELVREFRLFKDELKGFPFAVTGAFYGEGKGGFLSIAVNPDKCKGCMECVKECPEEALVSVDQTDQTVASLGKNLDFWRSLPNTDRKFIRTENLDRDNAYTTLFLDKNVYRSMVGGDSAPPGSAKKTVVHLFTGLVESLVRSHLAAHRSRIDELTEQLEGRIKLRLAVDVADTEKLKQVASALKGHDCTLSELSEKLDRKKDPVDTAWLVRVVGLLEELKRLKEIYSEENGARRSSLGMVGLTGHGSAWASTFPHNPFSFPWTQHLLAESPSVAAGLFEGHMKKMTDMFRVIRMADLEVSGKYNPGEHDPFFEKFGWRDLTDGEFRLCPPVVVAGNSRTLYGQALQNLNRLLDAGIPVKVLLLDTLQSPAHMPLVGLAHRNTYVLQGGMGNIPHLVKGLIEGLEARHPALFHVFSSHLPEQGVVTDMAVEQARRAVKSRSYPVFSYHPERGGSLPECLSLDGNPVMEGESPAHVLQYIDENGKEVAREVPYTFADFVATEGGFEGHFKKIPQRGQDESLAPIAEFLELDAEGRKGRNPFIWSVDEKKNLCRLAVSDFVVRCCEERRAFWNALKSLKRLDVAPVDKEGIKEEANREIIGRITQSLVQLAMGKSDAFELARKLARPASPSADGNR